MWLSVSGVGILATWYSAAGLPNGTQDRNPPLPSELQSFTLPDSELRVLSILRGVEREHSCFTTA